MMAEVSTHDNLVLLMERWVCSNLLMGDQGRILCDLPHRKTPPRIGNNVPDLYVSAYHDIPFILGEAKTAVDIETKRSHEQIATFLRHCDKVLPSRLILAVPWYKVPYARNLLRILIELHKITGVEALVLENLPG